MSTKPPQYVIDRCNARAVAHPQCYVYCAEIDGHWYVYARKSLRHAKSLLESGTRVWLKTA